ncbi:11-beta-hydroxysteroid dehydrogenase 1B [Ananas comosus]|uniref:11-beta-hydroxysteroid dehydrogenase 1B n=1 Tax=Ananas comosus TaxID=4615 RepID=A0A199UUK3_ANACO|nr:11-beta-hydroxysteroid dehydrogenase 1B [Ananas comosus]
MTMDLINKLMNVVAPPMALVALFLLVPPLYLYKLLLSFLYSLFPEDLTHKVVLITGASSGIGEQLAYEYAKKGAALVLVARREGSLQEVAERARDLGLPDVLVIPADVAKPEDCQRFVGAVIAHFGRRKWSTNIVDHLVNNAGIANVCLFDEAPDVTKFTPVMDVNFWGSVYPTHYALSHLKKTKGRIVVNSSASGWLPLPRQSFYNVSNLKHSFLRFNVGITIATPSFIESEMTKGKFLTKDGRMEINQELRDYAAECARCMVEAARRGERRVTVPAWFRVLHLWWVFAPEVFDWCFRVLYDVNFWGSVYPTHFALPHLEITRGRIVGVASFASYMF